MAAGPKFKFNGDWIVSVSANMTLAECFEVLNRACEQLGEMSIELRERFQKLRGADAAQTDAND
jgi:hypothetical protein